MTNQQGAPEALAHELFAAAQLAPGEGILDAVARIAALVEAQQPAPSAAAAEPDKADPRKFQLQGIVFALARLACVPPIAPALEHQLERLAAFYFDNGDEKFAQKLVLLKRGAFANGRRSVLVPSAAPTPQADSQPGDKDLVAVPRDLIGAACSAIDKKRDGAKTLAELRRYTVGDLSADITSAPQADSQPAPQGETNVQLDTDSNHSASGQQRDVAGPVALGQPMGDGPDQAAGHLSAQGDKLLTVAERNIRSFLRSAVFKSESDREAALNCVDVLWAAARAQADSQPAPIDMVLHCPACGLQHIDAPDERTPDWKNEPHRSHLCHGCGHIWRPADVPTNGVKAVKTTGKADSPIAARAPADSVLEDAARLEQIAEAIRDYHYALDMRKHGGLAESAAFSSICNTMGMHWNRGEEAARRAAREQGGA